MFKTKTYLLAGGVLAISSLPAFALDSNDFMQKFTNAYAEQGRMNMTYGDVTPKGDDGLVVSDLMISSDANEDAGGSEFRLREPVTATFEGITENGDGSYTVARLHTGPSTLMFGEHAALGADLSEQMMVHVPAMPDIDNMSGWLYAEDAMLKDIFVSFDDNVFVTIEEADIKQKLDTTGSQINASGYANGVKTDLTVFSDMPEETAAMLEALGLMKTNGHFETEMSWNLESGLMDLASSTLTLDNVGTLSLALAITGFDSETFKQLQELNEMPAPSADDVASESEEAKAYQAKALAAAGKLGIKSTSISFADDGLTNRLLSVMGAAEGLSAAQEADKLKAEASAGLAALEMPDVAAMVNAALESYFADPQNLSISIAPQMEMPAIALFMAGAASPQSLPQILNLQVTANE